MPKGGGLGIYLPKTGVFFIHVSLTYDLLVAVDFIKTKNKLYI